MDGQIITRHPSQVAALEYIAALHAAVESLPASEPVECDEIVVVVSAAEFVRRFGCIGQAIAMDSAGVTWSGTPTLNPSTKTVTP